ncbi:MAG: AsnC family transcriptional regulator [Candidatus ainarchaeum sp.]|nr:AsnC family transcriptional regulator [Candidatus ainarchaeum sp.]
MKEVFPNIDKVDLKIIKALEQNSRMPSKAIAKLASVNEHVVAYRIERLVNSGLINKIYCIISRGALFPVGYRVFLRFQNLSAEKEKAIVKRAVDCGFVNWVALCRGHWDMVISLFVNNPKHFMQLFSEMIAGFEDFIQEKEIVSYYEVFNFNRAYLYGGNPIEMQEYDGEFRQKQIDELDKKILNQLSANSRLSFIEMAQKFNASPDTIRNRIKQLEKQKILLGHGVLLNLEKIGYSTYLVLLNFKNLSKTREKALRSFTMQHPNVIWWLSSIGAYDLSLELEASEKKLDEFIVILREKFWDIIKNIEILTLRESLKYTYVATD